MCQWCESQYDGDEYEIQDSGFKMIIYNGNYLGVYDDNDNLVAYVEITVCPNCGREL